MDEFYSFNIYNVVCFLQFAYLKKITFSILRCQQKMSFYNGIPFCCIKSLPLLTTWRVTGTIRWTHYQRIPVFHKFQTRNTTSFPKSARKLKAKDNVPNDYNLIYIAPLNNYVTFSKCFGIFSALSVTISSFLYFYSDKTVTDQLKIGSLYLYNGTDDVIGFTALSLCMACGVIIISRKCTLRIYHNPAKSDYVAVFPSAVPFKTTKINFDNAVKDKSVSFLFKNVTYKLGTKKAFLLEHYFKAPINLTEMLVETSK